MQVNTSGEETKYGLDPDICTELAQYIKESCKHLKFAGLMTIGQPDYSSKPENFEVRQVSTRFKSCLHSNTDVASLEVVGDVELAWQHGP